MLGSSALLCVSAQDIGLSQSCYLCVHTKRLDGTTSGYLLITGHELKDQRLRDSPFDRISFHLHILFKKKKNRGAKRFVGLQGIMKVIIIVTAVMF